VPARIPALEICSPDNFQPAIAPENFVGGHYRNVLRYCLGNDLPIKWITMMQRQIEERIGIEDYAAKRLKLVDSSLRHARIPSLQRFA
jgi:hypothetical protein